MSTMRDKVVVITGSTRGLGYAFAEAMAKAGARVIISGRSEAGLRRAVKALRRHGEVTGIRCDVRREAQVQALARQTVKRYGRIDVWVNNAGYSASAGRMVDTQPHEAVDMFLANDMGTLYGTRAALHFMTQRKQGTLVNLYGAGSFLRPATPTGLYGATKAWVTSFTRSLAKEMQGSGVQIVGYGPGMVLTDMLTKPTVIGEAGRAMMKRYAFVLRLLAVPPKQAADRLVSLLESQRGAFVEYRALKPWSPVIRMMRIGWENLTGTGRRPTFRLKTIEPDQPRI